MTRPKKSVKRNPKRPPIAPTLPPALRDAPPDHPVEAPHTHATFPIVGIGSSAGGLESLEEFFRHLPADLGAAFVVVSHQQASHSSLLPEILRRWTALPVIEASDGLSVEPNTVYLPPPGSRLAILHAVLHLMDAGDGVRPLLPIDYFLCSLAEDQQEKAVGIILSGTGTDGSLGLKAIRAESGMTMAQEPRSAKFAGMPQSAIALGVVDIVRPPAEIGLQLSNFFHHRTVIRSGQVFDGDGKRNLDKILVYLRDRIGNDFSLYKSTTTLRRIERRMNLHQIATLSNYAQYLQSDPVEAHALFCDLLIGVTSFFRDPSTYDVLMQEGFPELLDKKPEGSTVRVWVPACSTGEEAYSLAMLLQEYRTQHKRRFTIHMFATDIDGEAIDKARHGLYSEGIVNQMSPERLQSFFVKEDSHYRVKSELRDCVTFATHNLLRDAPFTKLDILSCRNFLIYLRPETQHGLIPLFHYALKPMGLLILGTAETVDGFTNLFTPLDRKSRIFSRDVGPASLPIRETRLAPPDERVTPGLLPGRHRMPEFVESIHTLLLDHFVPPAVFVNRQGHAVYIQGRTGDYLEPAPGAGNQHVMDMVRPGLRPDLLAALQLAHKQGGTVVRKGVRLKTSGSVRPVTLTVTRLSQPGLLDGLMMVVFDTPQGVKSSAKLPKVRLLSKRHGGNLELEYARQRLHQTNADLQVSNEEFKSSNEELQSTNEELQSTNEELETTKEELQSLNEELITVNAQLQNKFEEAANANDDLKNLVNSTEVATIFLDSELRIKRFTPDASRVSKVIATDIGRPFGDIASTVRDDGLLADARSVLHTLVFKEREVQTEDGHWYLLRIMPYRTSKNLIDGVVLTYLEITAYKHATSRAESIVDGLPSPLIVLDTDLRVVTANRSFYQLFACKRGEVERHPIDRILKGRFNHPALRTALEKRYIDETGMDTIELEREPLPVKEGRWRASISRIEPANGEALLLLLALQHGSDTHPPLIDR
jgi:two-component system, chemotaxis family, CheB/CheR fusion protein